MAGRYGSHVVSVRSARAARREAALAGSDTAPYHGGCQNPVVIPVVGIKDYILTGLAEDDADYYPAYGKQNFVRFDGIPLPPASKVQHAMLSVRCRKCPWCLKRRGIEWAERSVFEIGQAQRTWFVTLTLSPEAQFAYLARARASAAAQGVDFDDPLSSDQRRLPADVQERIRQDYAFRNRVTAIGAEITKWLKRVRKNSGSRLRYALVAEAHKSGDPHFHALVHEVRGSLPLSYRCLTGAWKVGFSSAKLVDHSDARKAAWYTSKYLAKSNLARMRASALYGRLAKEQATA